MLFRSGVAAVSWTGLLESRINLTTAHTKATTAPTAIAQNGGLLRVTVTIKEPTNPSAAAYESDAFFDLMAVLSMIQKVRCRQVRHLSRLPTCDPEEVNVVLPGPYQA